MVNDSNMSAATLPTGITNIGDGNWYHIIVECTNTNIVNYFINNQFAGSFTITTPISSGTYNSANIGVDWNLQTNGGDQKFIMDDFRLYKRVLTPLEKANIYYYSY
jgi:hypothetical protein